MPQFIMPQSPSSKRHLFLIALMGALFLLEACDDDPSTTNKQDSSVDLSVVDQMLNKDQMIMADMVIIDQKIIDQNTMPTDQDLGDQAINDQAIDLQIEDAFIEAQCKNGIDDDGDGVIDYPRDPSCASASDIDEANVILDCANGIDDDADGKIDLDDLGCFGANDQSEFNQCLTHDVMDIGNRSRIVVDSEGAPSLLEACRSNNAPEQVFIFTLNQPVSLLEFSTKGSAVDTYLSIRRVCDDVSSELACNDDINNQDRSSLIQLSSPPLGDYFIIIDAFGDTQGRMVLNTQALIEDGQACSTDANAQSIISCGLGSLCIEGICQKSICSDGIDNNGNGIFDYPNDPGCDSARDQDETVPEILPACADGLDNDRDGRSDYPNDPQCTSAGYTQETPKVVCEDGLDNDQDGYIDLDDPGCMNDPLRPSEFNSPACSDAIDNDQDGRIDYPGDPGCINPTDNNERNIGDLPQCADGIDNDQDGLSDFPDDQNSCADAADQTEDNPCERRTIREITGLSSTRGNSIEESNDFSGSCGGAQGKESIVKWVVAQDRPLRSITFSTENSDIDTVLYLKNTCDGNEIACNDNTATIGNASRVTLNNQAAGEIYLVVDSRTANGGIWRMQIDLALEENAKCSGGGAWQCAQGLACLEQIDGVQRCVAPACGNGRDDDQDSYTDYPNDPGCNAFEDVSERDPGLAPTCFNLVDDDGDLKADFPADPDCESAADPSESPACADGIDNDMDGFTDFSGMGFPDSSCVCANGISEDQRMQCADGCDNDADGLIDLQDPGCASTNDNNETHTPQCRDNIDNNQDGRLDYPRDPGCTSSNDPLENTLNPLPACGNGLDDDADGLIDFPYDSGCVAASAESEISACNDTVNAQMNGKFSVLPNDGILIGNTTTLTPTNSASCTSGNANDAIVQVAVPYPAQIVANTFGSGFNTTLYARSSCHAYQPCFGDQCPTVPPSTELTCNQDVNGTIQSAISIDRYEGDLYLFVDGFGLQNGAFQLQVLGTYGLNQMCGPNSPAYLQCASGHACVLEPMLNQEICRPIQPTCERRSPLVFANTTEIQLPPASFEQADFVGSCGGRGVDHLIEWQHQGLIFESLSFMLDDPSNQSVLYQKQGCDGTEIACVQSNQMLSFNRPEPSENITLVVDQLQANQAENWRLVVVGTLAEGSKCGAQFMFSCMQDTQCIDDDQNGEGVCTIPLPPPPPPPPTPKQCDNQIDDDSDQLIDLLDPECTDVNDDDESQ
jgi:hypothetical protein